MGHDGAELILCVAQREQRGLDGGVGDLEVSAAGELLELDEREVGLDAGGVAVHQQADGAGGGDDSDLGVSEAVLLAEVQGFIPCADGAIQQVIGVGDVDAAGVDDIVIDGHGRDAQVLVVPALARDAVGGEAVIADDAEHAVALGLIAGERAELRGHLRAHAVGAAAEDGGQAGAQGTGLLAVVGDAGLHGEGAEVGIAQAECAVLPGELGNFLAGVAGHEDADLQDHGPEIDRVLVALNIEGAGGGLVELEDVERGEIARGVIEEHVLGAGVRGVDAACAGAGVPGVDG